MSQWIAEVTLVADKGEGDRLVKANCLMQILDVVNEDTGMKATFGLDLPAKNNPRVVFTMDALDLLNHLWRATR